MKNSIIILAKNIKLDKSYKNVLSYSENEMISLLTEHQVARREDFSFINKNNLNAVQVEIPYEDCLKANYIAYQNRYYSNKWFFAFIDSVEYVSDKTTRIKFTVDEHSTWHDYWDAKTCFVLREHVTNDTVGLHTIPEGLETGEFISNSHILDDKMDEITSELVYVLSTTLDLSSIQVDKFPQAGTRKYNGIASGCVYYPLFNESQIATVLNAIADKGQIEGVNGLFMIPKAILEGATGPEMPETDGSFNYTNSIAKQTTLNGYTPKNNKLLTGDYNYLLVSNNNGTSIILRYEDFSGTNCGFRVDMAVTPGCSIRMIPLNYKGNNDADEYGINMGKLPICSYPVDMYTNWLTQNSVNIGGMTVTSDDLNMSSAIIGSTVGLVASIATGNIGGAVSSGISGVNSIANSMMAKKQHELIPPQARGNLNAGDVVTSSGKNVFHFYKMSIKEEYAKSIDDYFTAFGYQVNTLKMPNLKTRTYFNYVQIGSSDNIGYPTESKGSIPASSMEVINNIYRAGVTIWHQHVHLGNYDVDNTI